MLVLTSKDMAMFESVARNHPRLREWLVSELGACKDKLVTLVDIEQVRRTQGYAVCLQTVIGNLDAALDHSRRQAGIQP